MKTMTCLSRSETLELAAKRCLIYGELKLNTLMYICKSRDATFNSAPFLGPDILALKIANEFWVGCFPPIHESNAGVGRRRYSVRLDELSG